MKKFVFELEDVLSYRKIEQQQAEADLAKALAEERKIQEQIDSLALQKVRAQNAMKGSVDVLAISNANNFYSFVANKTEELLNEITKAKMVSEEKREVLKKCMQRTTALENLKENQKDEYLREENRKENARNDDIVTSRFGRKE